MNIKMRLSLVVVSMILGVLSFRVEAVTCSPIITSGNSTVSAGCTDLEINAASANAAINPGVSISSTNPWGAGDSVVFNGAGSTF